MNYNNLIKYSGEMSASDLCDAIVEARTMDIPEVQEATRMLVDDLRDAILSSDEIYYLASRYTRLPHLNEHFGIYIFNDKYYAEKFVEKNTILGFEIIAIPAANFENTFSYFYDCGAECIDFCNDTSNVTFGLKHYFLSDRYNEELLSARMLQRFVALGMQEIRNVDKVYDRKQEIVMLLKKNIIAEVLSTNIYVPVESDGEQTHIVTMKADNNKVFFPVFTNTSEFDSNSLPGVKISPTTMLSFVQLIYNLASKDATVSGIVVNPHSVNFSMNSEVMKNVIDNAKN